MTSSMPSDLAIFSSAPDARLFQPLGSIEQCRVQLDHMLRHDAGLGLLIGPPGTGKSLLCQLLADNLRDAFEVVVLADSSPRDQLSLLQNILFQLNMPYRDCSEGELRLSLIDRLTHGAHSAAKGLILIVDEAQSLPDAILEEIRMITNIVRGGKSCVRTILAGNHELEERIGQPRFESLYQRIAVRCYLHPLDVENTAGFVRAKLLRHPGTPQLDDQAASAVHLATGGVPRLIHQLMRQVLDVSGAADITGEHVEQAWKQLHPLASPVVEPELLTPEQEIRQHGEAMIEFGELTSDDASPPACETLSSCETTLAGWHSEAEQDEAKAELAAEEPVSDRREQGPHQAASDLSNRPAAVAEDMPELAAQLDRVTDSLLKMAQPQEHEPQEDASVENLDAEQGFEAACDAGDEECSEQQECEDTLSGLHSTVADASVQWSDEQASWQPEAQYDKKQFDQEMIDEPKIDEPKIDEPKIDEPKIEPKNEPKIEPAALFGDGFEEEEPVPGMQSLRPVPQNDADSAGAAHAMADRGVDTDGEANAGIDANADIGADADIQADAEGPEHDLHCEVACISVEAATIQFEDEAPAAMPAIGTDGVGTGESLGDDICLSDDSDMLIVEDVVDAEPAPLRSLVYDDDPSDSVDYQRLLNRMRQG